MTHRFAALPQYCVIQMESDIGALESDQISRDDKPMRSLEVVLYGELTPESRFRTGLQVSFGPMLDPLPSCTFGPTSRGHVNALVATCVAVLMIGNANPSLTQSYYVQHIW